MFTYEQILDMNFPCPVEKGRMSVNPWGFYQQIDDMGWPCIKIETVKPGSSFDFVPVPRMEEVVGSLPPHYSIIWLGKEGKVVLAVYNGLAPIAKGETIEEVICNAYLYYKNISGK